MYILAGFFYLSDLKIWSTALGLYVLHFCLFYFFFVFCFWFVNSFVFFVLVVTDVYNIISVF